MIAAALAAVEDAHLKCPQASVSSKIGSSKEATLEIAPLTEQFNEL